MIIIKTKCPDCDEDIEIPIDSENGDIIICPCCQLELEFKNGKLIELEMEGEDWGE